MSNNPNDLLLGGGTASAKFPTIGTVVKGTIITDPESSQQTDINGKPITWDDGSPKMQIVLTLQTEDRDPSVEDDDGIRKLYVNGGKFTAVKAAVRSAGVGLQKGGVIAIQYTGDGTPSKVGYNAPKLFTAQYQPPSAAAANDLLGVGATSSPASAGVPANDLI